MQAKNLTAANGPNATNLSVLTDLCESVRCEVRPFYSIKHRGGAGFWSLGGSNCGVVDESSPQAKIYFWVAHCFWCVLVHCEEEINLVIFHLTCLKHVYLRSTCIGLSLANYGFGLTGRKIWLFCCWTNNAVLFLRTAYFVHYKSKTVTDVNITAWPILTRSVSNS